MFATQTTPGPPPGIPSPDPAVARAWQQIVEPLEPFLADVQAGLRAQIETFDPGIGAYADYALTRQGKQLRPLLVALSGRATGPLNGDHVTVAVIIEMVHLATLVHDDVMDGAEFRRNRPTLAANWGNELAVLLGDCLFAQALKLAASFPTPDICRAVADATKTVCSGEILQNQQQNNFDLAREEYFRVLEMKTAELFALSCDLGAYLAGATPNTRSALRQFGLALGMAYQLYDDCLDVFGSEAAAGKSLGTDLAQGKLTLPALLFWEHAPGTHRARFRHLVEHWQPTSAKELTALLARPDVLTRSAITIHDYLNQARQRLAHLVAEPNGLMGLTDYLAQQANALLGYDV